MQQYELLGAARINRIMQGLVDPRLLPQQLVWNSRIPDVPAAEDEIMARFIGTIQIADLIADDAKAVIYSAGRLQYETTKVPNLKVGYGLTQSTLNQLRGAMQGTQDEVGLFTNWENTTLLKCRVGVAQRQEYLKVAMLCDGIGFTYDRLGIKLTTPTWGQYSDLKVTVGTGWDTAASATPVSDIYSLLLTARRRYGISYNRITMSTPAFQYMIATTEFQNKAKTLIGVGYTFTNVNLADIPTMQALATRVLGLQIELYDAQYWSEDTSGVITSTPFLPITNVILTNTADDGNSQVWDFANGIVTESIVSNLAPVNIVGSLPIGRGPMAYATAADSNLNPPGIVYWGVARGFPRKHVLQASGVLSVGSFTDSIATTVPFPQ